MLKFLPGIILIQLVTCGLMLTIINWSHDFQLIIVIAVIGLLSAVLVAFWFSSIARVVFSEEQSLLQKQHAYDRERIVKESEREKAEAIKEKSKLQDMHARERERILLDAEHEKASIIEENYRKSEKEIRKAHAKANFKVGVAFTAALGAGGLMIAGQMITIGIMMMVASGSGLSGYLLRARQERLSRNKQFAIKTQGKMITHQSEQQSTE